MTCKRADVWFIALTKSNFRCLVGLNYFWQEYYKLPTLNSSQPKRCCRVEQLKQCSVILCAVWVIQCWVRSLSVLQKCRIHGVSLFCSSGSNCACPCSLQAKMPTWPLLHLCPYFHAPCCNWRSQHFCSTCFKLTKSLEKKISLLSLKDSHHGFLEAKDLFLTLYFCRKNLPVCSYNLENNTGMNWIPWDPPLHFSIKRTWWKWRSSCQTNT